MARLAPEDPYAGLAPADRLAKGPAARPRPVRPRRAQRRGPGSRGPAPPRTRPARVAGRHQHRRRLGQLVGLALAAGHQRRLLRRAPGVGLLALAPRPSPARARAWSAAAKAAATRWRADLPAPERIGAEAGRRAVARLGARKIDFDHRPGDLREPPGRLAARPADRRHRRPVDRPRHLVPQGQARPAGVRRRHHPDRGSAPPARPGLVSPFDDEGVANRRRALDRQGRADHLAAQHRLGPPAGPGDHRPRLARPGRPAGRRPPPT